MVKQVAKDRPMSFEDVGVIGAMENAAQSGEKFPLTAGEARAADAEPIEGEARFFASGFDRVEPEGEREEPQLPENFMDWPGFKLANGPARDNFINVVIFPGYVFVAPGRYVDAQNLNRVFDVTPDEIVPEGLYLVPVNYLASSPQRDKILRGDVAPEKAPRQPDPLRKSDKE